jgi:hypothetical protein
VPPYFTDEQAQAASSGMFGLPWERGKTAQVMRQEGQKSRFRARPNPTTQATAAR